MLLLLPGRLVLIVALVIICAQAVPAAPTAPTAVKSLNGWYDASDNSTITSSTSVSQWTDARGSSGYGPTLTQATSGAQPTWSSSGINGLGALVFSGGQTLASTTSFSQYLFPASTVFIVQNSANDTQISSSIWSGQDSLNHFNLALPNYGNCTPTGNSPPYPCLYLDFGDHTTNHSRLEVSAATNTSVGTHLWMGSASENSPGEILRRDGSQIGSMTQAYTPSVSSCPITIGGRGGCNYTPGFWFTGSIGEIVIYNTVLSSTNYQLVEGVLACKWGLQSQLAPSHPYASLCPSGSESTNLEISGAGLSAWYDADAPSTMPIGVSNVTDKSGKGNALTQATASNQPSLTTVSGQAFVFSGSQYLATGTSSTFATGSSPSSMFVVAAFTGTNNASYFPTVVGYGAASTGNVRGMLDSGSGYPYITNFGGDLDATTLWATTPTIVFGSFGSSQEGIAVNGGTLGTLSATPNTTSGTSLFVGKWVTPYYFWTGPIYEILIYNSALSTAEQQFLEGYLACKWGSQAQLPPTHPYKSCPTGTTSLLTVTLAVSPSGFQPPGTDLTYTTTFSNSTGTLAYNPIVGGPIPANTQFKVSTATQSLGNTGLTAGTGAVSYSSDSGATWGYAPISGANGAPSGYDGYVTNVRTSFTGALGPASTVNTGTQTYTVRIK
jgi:uncharacterized repeat protein (TIGR01451 family)